MKRNVIVCAGLAAVAGGGIAWGIASGVREIPRANTSEPSSLSLGAPEPGAFLTGERVHRVAESGPGVGLLLLPPPQAGTPVPPSTRPLGLAERRILLAASRAGQSQYYIADWTEDGELDQRDAEAFLAAFQAGRPEADMNGDGRIDAEDLAAFMQAFSGAEWRDVMWLSC